MADDITPPDLSAAAERIFAHCSRAVNERRDLTEFEDDALAVANGATGMTREVATALAERITLAERIIERLDAMARDVGPCEYGLPSRYGDEWPELVAAVVEILTGAVQ